MELPDMSTLPLPQQNVSVKFIPPNQSASITKLATALGKVQAEMKPAKKGSRNPHFDSLYADLADVMDAIREPLAKNDLCHFHRLRTLPEGVEVETVLVHSPSGEFISSTFVVPVVQRSAHGFGGAATYGRRYSLCALLGVVADVDDDGNTAQAANRPNGQSKTDQLKDQIKSRTPVRTVGEEG